MRQSRSGLLALALLAAAPLGCRDLSTGGPAAALPPSILSVDVVPASSGIFRRIDIELDAEGRVVVDYREAGGGGPALRIESTDPAAAHALSLLRLRPDRRYEYEVQAVSPTDPERDGGDAGPARTGTFSTGPLPPELGEVELETDGAASFELLFLEVGRPAGDHLPVIVDAEGHIVWHSLHAGRTASGFTLFEDTLFAFNTAEGIEVISPRSQESLARLSRAQGAERTGVDPFFIHHDVTATPRGTLLFLALDPTPAGDTVWMGEAVWEWDPWTDELERRWTSDAFLDPAVDRGPRSRPDDWLHANGLSIGPRGNVLVSFFWLHEVLSIAPGWEEIEWRLGGPASSFRGAEEAMEAGQHTPFEVAPGRVLLFDNGLDRGEGQYSRALEIELDPQTGRAATVWEFRPAPDIHAPVVSSVFRLPGGNTLVNFGLAEGIAGSTGPLSLFEVTPGGEVRWRMEVRGGWELVYRATPLGSIGGEERREG